MRKARVDHLELRERILASHIAPVAADLRLVEAADFIAFLRTGQFGNIASLVRSSAELCFRSGALLFGRSGDAAVGWQAAPSVALDMEFHAPGVQVYFRLFLERPATAVEIIYVVFDGARRSPAENTALLARALAEARIETATARR